MAHTVPERIPQKATRGERLLFQTLKQYLPDDYLVYYEPEIHGKRPDFVVIGPDLGLVVLEVKDYTKNTLVSLTKDDWEIRGTDGSQQIVKSPVKQARDNVFHLSNHLKKDKSLIQIDGKFAGSLKFPYGYGVVMSRLTQEDLVRLNLYEVLEPNLVLTLDEIDPDHESFSEERLTEKILNMFVFTYRMREPLSDEDMKAIRYHLFPEVRISAEFKEPVPYKDQLLLSLHDIKVMDIHQENLAKQLGDKHRLVRGVAGSGKTLILAARAQMLAKQHPDWKILILCYNISLSAYIRQMIQFKMAESGEQQSPNQANITVRNFHEWLKFDLRISEPQLPHVLEKLDRSEAILPKYDAILIDEGQDFAPEWLNLVSKLLNEETQSLLLVEDRAQTIYSRKRSYVQDTGLDFRGRSRILTINYRNTSQIVSFAWEFFQQHSQLKNKVRQGQLDGVEILSPQSTHRKGPEPAIIRAANFWEEMQIVGERIRLLHEAKKVPLSQILVLYRVKKTNKLAVVDIIRRTFSEQGIPFYWLTEDDKSKRNFQKDAETVKISTIDSSKGLDFQAVFVVNVDSMPFPLEENKEKDVSLLYIAMTRAIDYLSVSYSAPSQYTVYFEEIRKKRLNPQLPEVKNVQSS